MREASVVCRQLGYDGAVATIPWQAFGSGRGMTVMNRIQCTGNESSVSDCKFMRWNTDNCGSFDDPGAICTQPGI